MVLILDSFDNENNLNIFWEEIEKLRINNNFLSPVYSKSYFLYQKEYCISNNNYFNYKSFMIINNKNELLCAYIFLLSKNQKGLLEYNYGPDFPGLVILTEEIDRKNLSKFKENLFSLNNKYRIKFLIPQISIINKPYIELLNDRNFSHSIKWSRIINLKRTEKFLWSSIRKSFKSIINKGLKEQEILLIDHINFDKNILKRIQDLHHIVSGRITRSQASWDIQFDAIKNDMAFAFCAFENNNISSAIYFINNRRNAYYSVGIYTDEAKEKMYGHCLIWRAILYCKERGINLCEIDMDLKFRGLTNIDEKLKQISYFKAGFGGEVVSKHQFII